MTHSDPSVERNTTDHELNNFSPDIAERAKMRTRNTTKRSIQYTEEVIDITDDDFPTTPARKPKEKLKPRPKSPAPQLPLPSDPMTVPMPSSSPLLPPSDPFPASTVINSTPQPGPPDEVAAPDSSPQRSPVQRRKRKRYGRLHSLIDDPSDPNGPPLLQVSVTSPRSGPLPPSEDVFDASHAMDPGKNLNSNKADSEDGRDVEKEPKKRKSSKNVEKSDRSAKPEGCEAGGSRKKAVVEVVIASPRRRGSRKAKASKKDNRSLESNGSEYRNDRQASSPIPIELMLKRVVDEHGHMSPERTSDNDEDELILGPKRQPSINAKSRTGKHQHKTKTSSVNNEPPDNEPLLEVEPSSDRVAIGEEEGEEPNEGVHHVEGASTSRTNADHNKSRTRQIEHETPTPLRVGFGLAAISVVAEHAQENQKPGLSAQEDGPPKSRPRRETPAPGKLHYTFSRSDRTTPMRELIRRASSHPSAPFSTPYSPIASPLAKTTKSALRRIAPLHPTRRTPPPPPPRPPPPKKSKKMLNLEEKWEMELEDEVEGWWALVDEERQAWRRAKRERELGYDD